MKLTTWLKRDFFYDAWYALRQTGRILTLDRDFRLYRWGKNRPFQLLIEF